MSWRQPGGSNGLERHCGARPRARRPGAAVGAQRGNRRLPYILPLLRLKRLRALLGLRINLRRRRGRPVIRVESGLDGCARLRGMAGDEDPAVAEGAQRQDHDWAICKETGVDGVVQPCHAASRRTPQIEQQIDAMRNIHNLCQDETDN
eukprot:6172849-Pleurochrysis_carterae.AAC.1